MPISLVTGANSGLGLATATRLAEAGHRVYAALRNPARGEALREAASRDGIDLELLQLDVTDDGSVREGIAEVLDREGHIDVLVNNAGVSGAAPLEETPEDDHRQMFEANYWGVIRTTQAVLPTMRSRGEGAIVNLSSVAGAVPVANQVAYSASKHAVEAASEALAVEVSAFGIRVAIIQPGVFATSIWENSSESTHYDRGSPYKHIMRRNGKMYATLLRQAGDPARVADAVLEAITTDEPRLRWPVGDDAHAMIAGRDRTSAEERLRLGHPDLSDEEVTELYRTLLGIPWS